MFFSFVCCLFGVGLLINRRSGISFVRARFFSFVNLKEEKKKKSSLLLHLCLQAKEKESFDFNKHTFGGLFPFPPCLVKGGGGFEKEKTHRNNIFSVFLFVSFLSFLLFYLWHLSSSQLCSSSFVFLLVRLSHTFLFVQELNGRPVKSHVYAPTS